MAETIRKDLEQQAMEEIGMRAARKAMEEAVIQRQEQRLRELAGKESAKAKKRGERQESDAPDQKIMREVHNRRKLLHPFTIFADRSRRRYKILKNPSLLASSETCIQYIPRILQGAKTRRETPRKQNQPPPKNGKDNSGTGAAKKIADTQNQRVGEDTKGARVSQKVCRSEPTAYGNFPSFQPRSTHSNLA